MEEGVEMGEGAEVGVKVVGEETEPIGGGKCTERHDGGGLYQIISICLVKTVMKKTCLGNNCAFGSNSRGC